MERRSGEDRRQADRGTPDRRGRKRRFDGTVSIRLTKELHDRLALEAIRGDKDLSQVIREKLAR